MDDKMIEVIKPDFVFEDERGALFQLVRTGYKQVNVIYSNENVIRGGHYHKVNKEAFFVVSGRCKVKASLDNVSREYEFGKSEMFVIHENVMHDFDFLENTILVSMYSNGVELEGNKMDIYNK